MAEVDGDDRRPKWREWLGDLLSTVTQEDGADLRRLIEIAGRRENIDESVQNIISGALQVSEMHARDIMVTRSQIVFLQENDSAADVVNKMIAARHSRFPVIGEDIDDVKGILHAKDVLPWILEERLYGFNIRKLIRPVITIPGSKRLNILLNEFQTNRAHMAIVLDEYGDVAGLVTIEDVLEQIVGDIEDEYDIDDDYVKQVGETEYDINASMPIEDFNEHFNAELEANEVDTVAGVVVKNLGHLPGIGEEVVIDGFTLTVANSDNRRIKQLRVTCPAQ